MDLLRQTLTSLRAHALRFTLTSLGILWGAFMLTYATASARGMDVHFRTQLEATGPRLVYLFPGVQIKNRVGERGARPLELEAEDVARLEVFDAVEGATPNLIRWNQVVRARGRTKLLNVAGVAPQVAEIRNFRAVEGRFLSDLDVARHARVAVLGAEARRRLFGSEPAVGRTIHVEGQPFEVCGVAAEKGEQLVGLGGGDDQSILVPYTAVQRWLSREEIVDEAVFAPVTGERSYEAIARVRESVGLHHGFAPTLDTALSFINIYDIMGILDRLFFGLQFFMFAASLITLAVGAVSVTNIMLVVVAERTREIGLRKAVGAPSGAIFRAFLAETTAVCVASGVVGAALGVGLARWVAWRVETAGSSRVSAPVVDPFTVLTLVAVLVGVGIVAGVLPALRAARIPPAEALRSH